MDRGVRQRTNRRLRRSAAERRPTRAVDIVVVAGDRLSNQLADRALCLRIGGNASLFDDEADCATAVRTGIAIQ